MGMCEYAPNTKMGIQNTETKQIDNAPGHLTALILSHKADRIKKGSASAGEAAWKAGGAARIEARRGTRAGDERPREPPARGPRRPPERARAPGRPRPRGPGPGPSPARSKEKAPPMSGTPYPPTDLLRSTFGEEGLNFRVRNGIG